MKAKLRFLPITLFCALVLTSATYPIDGYDETGIRRLKRLQLIMSGEIKEKMPIVGAQKSICDITLNLQNAKGDSLNKLPKPDARLQKSLDALFPNLDESYSIAALDITPGKPLRYAARKEMGRYQPGSVGKIAVAAGFFTEISKIYPNSFEKRQDLMRIKQVRAGKWAMVDEHTVPFFDPETNVLRKAHREGIGCFFTV